MPKPWERYQKDQKAKPWERYQKDPTEPKQQTVPETDSYMSQVMEYASELPGQVLSETSTGTPNNRSMFETMQSAVTGQGRRVEGVPEIPVNVPNIRHAQDPEQAAQLMRQYGAQSSEAKIAEAADPGRMEGLKRVVPAGVDEYNNPLFVSDKPIAFRDEVIQPGQQFYANKPGLSTQDLYDLKEVVPEALATSVTGWKKGLASAFLAGFGNKFLRTSQVDLQTDDFRTLPKRLGQSLAEAGYATLGEGAGRVASHALTHTLPNTLTKIWVRNTNNPLPRRWVDADGNLTEEALQGFRDLGIDQADIQESLIEEMAQAPTKFRNATEAVRYAESKAMGVEPTVTDLVDIEGADAARREILRETPSAGGDLLRNNLAKSSETARQNVAELAGERLPKTARSYVANLSQKRMDAAKKVRSSLRAASDQEKAAASAMYEAAKDMPQVGDFNIRHNTEAAFSEVEDNFKQQIPGALDDIRRTLAKYGYFGLDDAANEVVEFDLTLNNAAELAKKLNKVRRKTSDEQVQAAYDAVVKGLYNDMASVDIDPSLAIDRDIPNAEKIMKFQEARKAWGEYMTRWKNSNLIEGLIERKAGPTPRISDSDAYTKIMKASSNEMKFIKDSLRSAGPEGIDALKEAQSTVMMNLLEDSMDSGSNVIGRPILSSDKFIKNLGQFKDGALEELLSPSQMMHFKRLERVLARQKTGGLTSMSPVATHENLVMQSLRNLLGSIWLFRHSPTVGGIVASGKVGLSSASQLRKKKAAKALLQGAKTVGSDKFQKRVYDDTIIDVFQRNFPKLMTTIQGAGEATRVGVKEEIRSRGRD